MNKEQTETNTQEILRIEEANGDLHDDHEVTKGQATILQNEVEDLRTDLAAEVNDRSQQDTALSNAIDNRVSTLQNRVDSQFRDFGAGTDASFQQLHTDLTELGVTSQAGDDAVRNDVMTVMGQAFDCLASFGARWKNVDGFYIAAL